jgi:hypothetical protein
MIGKLFLTATPEFRDLSPKQIVPQLADRGVYVASESSNRHKLYEEARLKNPNRWSRNTRNWEPVETVYLNPESKVETKLLDAA